MLIFMIVLARMGGLVTFAPFWSHRLTPTRVRAVLAMGLALVLTPVVAPRLATPPTEFFSLALIIVGELLIGMAIGLVGRLVFSALDTAAHVLGFQMGFSLASTIDPATRAQTAALGVIAQMLGLVVLLGADGHRWLLAATVKSFQIVAPGNFSASAELIDLFIRLSANAIATGVALTAPAIVVLLSVELALAVMGRAAPQLQIMVLGFPIKIAVGLWLLGASLYFMPAALRSSLEVIRTALNQALAVM
ncbi:MAG: flagellar biosynthetic protein FliR [Pyrinomonadaceae bacterium]